MPSMLSTSLALLGLILSLCTLSFSALDTIQLLTAITSDGPITGHFIDGNVIEYLGIPYAEPPVGSLRFMPPQKLNRSEPYEAANWGYDCPRLSTRVFNYTYLTPEAPAILAALTVGNGTPQSEDCLTLNVWKTQSAVSNKPVLVYFYGGRFASGNTNTPFWNGRHLAAAEDVIVVTLNYRTNILGFPGAGAGHPDRARYQNLALRDQRIAVEWIRDNIAAFGGDTQRIVLAGQSSGAVAVDYWAYAHEDDPIVAGLILLSGSALSFPLNTLKQTIAAWHTTLEIIGCAGGGFDQELECMQGKDWEAIRSAAATVEAERAASRPISALRSTPAFWPVVDSQSVFADYLALNGAGRFAKVPILLGNDHIEEGYYVLGPLARGGLSALPSDSERKRFDPMYFTCPLSAQASARKAHNVPAWQYRYFGNWPQVALYNIDRPGGLPEELAPYIGAYHSSELFMIFGTAADVTGIEPSDTMKGMIRVFQGAIGAFCRDPASGLSDMGWPVFDQERRSLVRLGFRDRPRADFVRPDLYSWACDARIEEASEQ